MNPLHWILATALVITLLFSWNQSTEVDSLRSDVITLTAQVKSKQALIDEQKKEIAEMPKRYIETTRAIDKEICLGLNQIDRVMSMSAEYNTPDAPVQEVLKYEKPNISNIDAKLPPDLIKLLNED